MKVAVVGAGFAGLTAATTLREHGIRVEVFEARDRVGGRVWSRELVPGDSHTVIERGAEFVLEGYERMRAIAGHYGLSFADMGMSYYVREPRGGAATTAAAISQCAEEVAKAAAAAPWGPSLTQVAAEISDQLDPAALAGYLSRLAVTNAFPEHRLNAAVAADMTSGFARKASHRIVGGNQRLAIEMSKRLDSAVHLNSPVTAIDWSHDEVRLRASQHEFVADRLVLAVPLAIGRELFFAPSLPAWKVQAWQRAGLGQAAKLHVPLLEQAPPTAVQDVAHRFWTWTATDESGVVQPVVHCFSGSVPALDALEVAVGPATWASRVAELRPELSLDVENALVTSWADDPFAREAYTALSVDVAEGDDDLMARAVASLYFAGEHTAGDWAGLMEGAIRSGERAASEVEQSFRD